MMTLERDDGFTLSELLVVVVLMGIILAVAYGGYYVVAGGVRISDRQSHFAQEIGGPLDTLERIVMQQNRILTDYPEDPRPTQIKIYTDMDSDDHYETQFIQATADNRLVIVRSEEVDSPTPRALELSTHNYNVAAGVPLFTYYDATGAEIPQDQMNQVSGIAYAVKITVVTEYDGERYSDSRHILFRN